MPVRVSRNDRMIERVVVTLSTESESQPGALEILGGLTPKGAGLVDRVGDSPN